MLHKYVAHLLVHNEINSHFQVGVSFLQLIQTCAALIDFQASSGWKDALMFHFGNPLAFGVLLIVFQLAILGQICAGYYLYNRNEPRPSSQKQLSFVVLTKTINYSLFLFAKLLVLPLYFYIGNSFAEKNSSANLYIAVIILILYLALIVPATFIGYFNKFCINQNSLAYPFVANLYSWIHFCSHFIGFLSAASKNFLPYFCGIMLLFTLPILFFNSPSRFVKNPICDWLNSIVISLLFITFITKIFLIQLNTVGQFFLLIFLCLGFAFLFKKVEESCTERSFNSKLRQQNKLLNFVKNHNQVIFHHILNFSEKINKIFIEFLQHESTCLEINCQGKTIIKKIKQGQDFSQFFSEIKQFFILLLQLEYNPHKIESLGQTDVDKLIDQKGHLFILIVQLMIIKDEEFKEKQNLKKAYSFLKEHERVISKTSIGYTFMAKVEIEGILQIIEDELTVSVKKQNLNGGFDSKSMRYFQFQQKMESFKDEISQVCDINIEFWNELMHKETDNTKVKDLLIRSEKSSRKVIKNLKQLVSKYRRSCLATYELIFQYSRFVLNCNLTSIFNPFSSLETQYKEQLDNFIKQNNEFTILDFDETSQTSVCVISAEKANNGEIEWENQNFRREFPMINKDIRQRQTSKKNISSLIPPFFRESHQNYIHEFSQTQKMMFGHENVLLYCRGRKINYLRPYEISVQIYPTLKKGLKYIVYLKNVPFETKQETKTFIIDERLETTIFTKSLIKQWEYIDMSDYLTSPLEQYFRGNHVWQELLTGKITKGEIKLDMETSDFNAKLSKILTNQKGLRCFYFEVSNLLAPDLGVPRHRNSLQAKCQTRSQIYEFISHTAKSLKENSRQETWEKTNQIKAKMAEFQHLTHDMKKIYKQKSDQEIALQKVFQTILTPKTPKKIIYWRLASAFLIICLLCGIIANMFISIQRKNVYLNVLSTVENFNQLTSLIQRSLISLREYNYNAMRNVQSPSLPYFKHQLEIYQSEMAELIPTLKPYMNDPYSMFEFIEDGSLKQRTEILSVIVSNLVLSSINYLSEQPFESLAFPYFQKDFPWYLGMNQVESNFLNAMWNGMYVCLGGMMLKRNILMESFESQVLPIEQQMYIFSLILGSLAIILLILFSILIQRKSNKFVQDSCQLLEEISAVMKTDIIQKIEEFKQKYIIKRGGRPSSKDNFNMKQSMHYQADQLCDQDEKLTENKSKTTFAEQNTFTTAKSKEQETFGNTPYATQTDRELKSSGISSPSLSDQDHIQNGSIHSFSLQARSSPHKLVQNSPKAKACQKTVVEQIQQQRNSINLSSKKTFVYVFYVAVAVPILSYFILVFYSGLNLNDKVWFSTNYQSALMNLKTHQEYNYFISQGMFYYQGTTGNLNSNISFGDMVLPFVLSIYENVHFIERSFIQIDQKSDFAQIKDSLDSNNVCNFIDLFTNQSVYYNITFQKAECQEVADHVLMKGFKSAFVYLTEASVELVSRNMRPQNLTNQERIKNLQGPQLMNYKKVLAYSQRMIEVITKELSLYIVKMIDSFIKIVNIFSIILIFSLLLIVKAINFTWHKMRGQAKHVQAILRLISFRNIRKDKTLKQKFLSIDYKFYS